MEKYSKKWELIFKNYNEKNINLPSGWHYSWSKWFYLKKILTDYDWVIWLDADCLIMDFSYDLSQHIDNNYLILIGKVFGNPKPPYKKENCVNSGIFYAKNNLLTIEFIDEIIKHYDRKRITPDWAFNNLILDELNHGIKYTKFMKKLERRPINMRGNVPDRSPGKFDIKKDIIYHISGKKGKAAAIKKMLPKIKF